CGAPPVLPEIILGMTDVSRRGNFGGSDPLRRDVLSRGSVHGDARILWINSKNPTNNFADYTPAFIREQQRHHSQPWILDHPPRRQRLPHHHISRSVFLYNGWRTQERFTQRGGSLHLSAT